ncbi:hypothetical protein EYC84_003582 [Monilinia fructicola]|uniref:Uncharacterized protein n=1 Tax=Monilinia fructicola TaxID=38448 RepID=A0A5M9JU38_MONFR|nr:hypothetical protein EYC84_003582 [Monilinia fructicola]
MTLSFFDSRSVRYIPIPKLFLHQTGSSTILPNYLNQLHERQSKVLSRQDSGHLASFIHSSQYPSPWQFAVGHFHL